jgi:tetratricopeptide (TPR) repeat protein
MKSAILAVTFALVFAPCAPAKTKAEAQTAHRQDSLPLSTKSPRVLRLLDQAWALNSNKVEQDKAVEVMRQVVKADPKFAMGHEILSQISFDPGEQVREQREASATKKSGSPAEQTVIDWFQNAANHRLIPAIISMNDVLRKYPHDKWLVFLASSWLMKQTQYERAAEVYEKSGIKNSPGLINSAAYTYVHMRQYRKAFALMDQYVAMAPHDANPNDSYGELLRLAGHYNSAIEHYKAALAINPQFYPSEFGIADTYMVMGDEARAREGYEKAFQKFSAVPEMNRIQWKTHEASTYLYEDDIPSGDKAFQSLADYARSKHVNQVEADIYRQMALYQPHSADALGFLAKAEKALHQGNSNFKAVMDQEAAQILRARVELGIKFGDLKMADSALTALAELSEESSDKVIDSAYQGAEGARLFSAHRYKAAIPHLGEDADNPFSIGRLAEAYRATGYVSGAKRTEEILATFSDPTVEQALVVPAFRKCLANPNCNANFSAASMKH